MTTDLAATLAALAEQGAKERQPLRWAFVEALARRATNCPPRTRAALDQRLAAALADLSAQLSTPAAAAPAAPTTPSPGPLAELSAALRAAALDDLRQPTTTPPADVAPASELKALRYFRPTWSKLSVERQVDQALAQAPENAGPLNSHRLVLDTLQDLRSNAPDYLSRFLAYADALLWLDRASAAASGEKTAQKAPEKSAESVAKKGAKKANGKTASPRPRKTAVKKAGDAAGT
jgi:hypothetical protein